MMNHDDVELMEVVEPGPLLEYGEVGLIDRVFSTNDKAYFDWS